MADMREPADRIMIVSNGSIDLYVYSCDLVFNTNAVDVRSSVLMHIVHPLSIYYRTSIWLKHDAEQGVERADNAPFLLGTV